MIHDICLLRCSIEIISKRVGGRRKKTQTKQPKRNYSSKYKNMNKTGKVKRYSLRHVIAVI